MIRTATAGGCRDERLRALLSAVAVGTGMWLSGVVDQPASGSSVNEAIGDIDGVWTWVAESPAVDAWSDEPVVSYIYVPCSDAGQQPFALRRDGRES